MSASLIAACLWALAATVTAMLPFRRQFPPGVTLLIVAPLLILWVGHDYGIWVALAAVAGFLSMFRRPLIFLARRALGRAPVDERQP